MCLAIPGRVIEIDSAVDLSFRTAIVDFTGITKTISLSLTPEARIGDYVLVHVGFALTVISEEEAAKTLAFIQSMTDAEDVRRELEGGEGRAET
jgi:hydrogenase expression/formation protein HypC